MNKIPDICNSPNSSPRDSSHSYSQTFTVDVGCIWLPDSRYWRFVPECKGANLWS